jgi:Ogr/Delta-like zinc finger protein
MKCSVCGKDSFPRIGQVISKTIIRIEYQCSDVNCSHRDTVSRSPGGLTPEESAVVKKIAR